ncbi:hypothetical protein L3X38_030952 [Prunus dulcis]|uniref:Malectin-like domain-containing protein n=1 Tax=Prunus dulcis TaxID=3755 RepID=A0AAD4YUH2_PRUDU|nr:hypothetical protein L3X38_030952 [Prunus dulcis]
MFKNLPFGLLGIDYISDAAFISTGVGKSIAPQYKATAYVRSFPRGIKNSYRTIYVCLVNKGSGTPFISALESRPLKSITYLSPTAPQALLLRPDVLINQLPSVVMSTASTSTNDNASMDFGWEAPDTTTGYNVYLHFANSSYKGSPRVISLNLSLSGLTGEILHICPILTCCNLWICQTTA